MIRYRDWDKDSGVAAFEIGVSYIDIQFKDGAVYRYTSTSAGSANIAKMAELAKNGEGLNSFINKVVRQRYEQRLR